MLKFKWGATSIVAVVRYTANIEWIGTLCSALSLACAGQLIITGIFAFGIPEVLLLMGSHLSTAAGLVAGFIALPTALRLKTAQISPNMDRIYGYTLCYQRLAICVSGSLHFSATVLAIVALVTTTHLGSDFFRLMRNYHLKQSSKALVDNIQYVLQCCGGYSYDDWFKTDWGGYDVGSEARRPKHSIKQLLREDTDEYPDLTLVRNDAVPFSCCARSVLSACIHQNLIQLGTSTINKCGCGVKLRFVTEILLWFEFVLYSLCFSIEIAVMVLLREPESQASKQAAAVYYKPRQWGHFSNEDSSTAVLAPSSHSEITLKSLRTK